MIGSGKPLKRLGGEGGILGGKQLQGLDSSFAFLEFGIGAGRTRERRQDGVCA